MTLSPRLQGFVVCLEGLLSVCTIHLRNKGLQNPCEGLSMNKSTSSGRFLDLKVVLPLEEKPCNDSANPSKFLVLLIVNDLWLETSWSAIPKCDIHCKLRANRRVTGDGGDHGIPFRIFREVHENHVHGGCWSIDIDLILDDGHLERRLFCFYSLKVKPYGGVATGEKEFAEYAACRLVPVVAWR